nr:ester cyclase [Geminicoccus flavidas]
MTKDELLEAYRAYIQCLNRRDWPRLGDHVADAARYNGETIGLQGYRRMLEGDAAAIPDLRFEIDFLVVDPQSWGPGSGSTLAQGRMVRPARQRQARHLHGEGLLSVRAGED